MQAEYFLCQRVFQVFLDSPVQRTGAELLIISFLSYEVLCLWCQLKGEAQVGQTFHNTLQQYIDDREDMILVERIENNHIVDTVKELGREGPLQRFFYNCLIIFIRTLCTRRCSKAYSITKIL